MQKAIHRRGVVAVAIAIVLVVAIGIAVGTVQRAGAPQTDIDRAVAAIEAAIDAPDAASVLHEGAGDAVLTIFSAPNCPHCRNFAATVLAVIGERPAITYQVREVAFTGAGKEAIAVMGALTAQGLYRDFYARFADYQPHLDDRAARALARDLGADMTALEASLADDAIAAEIAHNMDLARAAGLTATPSVIYKGRLLEGAVDRATLLRFIDEADS